MTGRDIVYPPTDSWIVAVHESEHDLTPLGTALVIDDHRILTCAHVVASEGKVRERLWLAFPSAHGGTGGRRKVASIVVADAPRIADLAILHLAEAVPTGVAAAPLRCPKSTDLVGQRWWAFGFANGDPVGNSADGLVGAWLAYGWIRLDADSRYHVEPGFSGGGLWSPDYEAVIGIVGEANDRGDGRAITLAQADAYLPGEKLGLLAEWSLDEADELALAAWGWNLEQDPEAAGHWKPRARGVTANSERGYRFRGRATALQTIVDWLDRESPDQRALVVTGSPGVGKSAVLGHIITTADPAVAAELPEVSGAICATIGSIACAVHAKGKTALEVATEIARAVSARLPESVEDMAPAVRDALRSLRRPRCNVIIDALDEASTPEQARAIVTSIIRPLVEASADLDIQVVVGTRRHDEGGDLIAAFGELLTVIDLDEPRFFSEDDLVDYVMATIQLVGDERPDNPYQNDTRAQELSRRIAELSGRNFLVAGLVARNHGLYDQAPIEPSQLAFTSTVQDAMGQYLQRVGSAANFAADQALTALAYAEAPGMPLSLWKEAVAAIGTDHLSEDQLANFAQSSVANFLIETGGKSSGEVFRIFHQALNESLLRSRSQVASAEEDERALTRALSARGRRDGWDQAPEYLLRSLASHAARAGLVDHLLEDDGYLLYADLRRLLPVADSAVSPKGLQRARLLRLTPNAITATAETRTAMFSVTESMENLGTSYTERLWTAPYKARWAVVRPRMEWSVLDDHAGPVWGICGFNSGSHALVASAGHDGTVRIWDAATATQQAVLEGHIGRANTVCSFTISASLRLASGGNDRTVRIWDPANAEQITILNGHSGAVNTVCALVINDRTLVASGATDRTVRIWDPGNGEIIAMLEGHEDRVNAVCAFNLEHEVLLASAGDDCTVRIWNPVTRKQIAVLEGHTGVVNAVCAFTLGKYTFLASAAADDTVRIWDPVNAVEHSVLEGHTTGWVTAVCSFSIGDRILLASAAGDRAVRIWDPSDGEQHSVLEGHHGRVNTVCSLEVNDRQLLASGADDHTVRIWDPTNDDRPLDLEDLHSQANSLCAFFLDRRPILASAGNDGAVRTWDPVNGTHFSVLSGHTDWVNAVCSFPGRYGTLLASAGNDRTVRIWDPATGTQQAILTGHDDWVNAVCYLPVGKRRLLASAAADNTVRIWDPNTGAQEAVLDGRGGSVRDVCSFTLDGRALLASAGDDGAVRIWDPATGMQQAVLDGRGGSVRTVCSFTLDGRALLASAGNDGTVRIWDLATGTQKATLEGHSDWVNDLCTFSANGRTLLASAADDRTLRIWDTVTTASLLTVPVHHPARAVDYAADSILVGLSAGLLAIELSSAVTED